MIEVAYLYRMSLLIGNPVFCAAVVLTSFLVCAGSGSRVAAVLLGRFSNASLVTCWSVAAVAVLLESAGPFPWQAAQSLPLWRRVAVAVVTIAPLAFLMGVPFPSGLSRVYS